MQANRRSIEKQGRRDARRRTRAWWVRHLAGLLLVLPALAGLWLLAQSAAPLSAAGANTIVVNTTADTLNDGDGKCSLREAIAAANTDAVVDACAAGAAGKDAITFAIPFTQLPRIVTLGGTLQVTEPITLDGASQGCGSQCVSLTRPDGAGVGLEITAGDSTVSGLFMDGFAVAIKLSVKGGNRIVDNSLGFDTRISASLDNNIAIEVRSSNNVIGGEESGGNFINGNSVGILIAGDGATGNKIMGNSLGVRSGGIVSGNEIGVRVLAKDNIIGGTAEMAGNQIVKGDVGVELAGSQATGNQVIGNVIGGGAPGQENRGHKIAGVLIKDGARLNVIGGRDAGAGNVVGFNTVGIQIDGAETTGQRIEGNFIGANAAGQTIANGIGVRLRNARNNVVGGIANGAGNVVGGNDTGILITNFSRDNSVLGNIIGTDKQAQIVLRNTTGVLINGAATDNVAGGAETSAGNLIVHNGAGVRISGEGSSGNRVLGNRIGVGAAAEDGGNTTGVEIADGASANVVGGVASGAGNTIGFNDTGILIEGSGTNSNVVLGNAIGTDITGVQKLGNTVDGVRIGKGASNNTIGGINPNNLDAPTVSPPTQGNLIAHNGGGGVLVSGASTGNRILGNQIFDNESLGIDLGSAGGANGVTANDEDDKDSGPNQLQNFPILAFVTQIEAGGTAAFFLSSTPNTTFDIELFDNETPDPSGHGEGKRLVGAKRVTTDADGNVAGALLVSGPEGVVTATATDSSGNTSEFSTAVVALDLRTCLFVNTLEDDLWLAGANWVCDRREGLPDLSTGVVITATVSDPERLPTIKPGENGEANQVTLGSNAGVRVAGSATFLNVDNSGVLVIEGDATSELGLVNQPGATIALAGPGTNGGSLTLNGGRQLGGRIEGSGQLINGSSEGLLSFAGATLAPSSVLLGRATAAAGAAPATLTLVGDTNFTTATLALDITARGHDVVAVDGAAVLGGVLDVRRVDGVGEYAVVTCRDGCSGAFSDIRLPAGVAAEVVYTETEARLRVSSVHHEVYLPAVRSAQ